MIAFERAILIAICCLITGTNSSLAQNQPPSNQNSYGSDRAPLPAPQLRPYATALPQSAYTAPPADYGVQSTPSISTTDMASPLPTTPAALPPALPERQPLLSPAPAQIFADQQTPMFGDSPVFKPSLSWRSRAYRMANNPNVGISRTLQCTFDDAVMTLITALPSQGLCVENLNSKAGELLAAPAVDKQSRQRYIFTLCETAPGSVLIKTMPLQSNRQSDDLLKNLLNNLVVIQKRQGHL
jgi:hypothetical protein